MVSLTVAGLSHSPSLLSPLGWRKLSGEDSISLSGVSISQIVILFIYSRNKSSQATVLPGCSVYLNCGIKYDKKYPEIHAIT